MDSNISINRRAFLKQSTGVAGLALGFPNLLKSNPLTARTDDIRVGFIGCGKQHRVLVESMMNLPGIRFVAACDIVWADRLQWISGLARGSFDTKINTYTDAEEMLSKEAKNLDAVFVASPDFWHAPHTVMALEAGCHVYCEKMMSDTIDGARSMVRAMERTGKLCQIGHQRRSNPRYQYVLNELIRKRGICGQIVNVNGQWNRSLSASQAKVPDPKKLNRLPAHDVLRKYGFGRGQDGPLSDDQLRHRYLNWRLFKDLSGGPISDLGAHQIDVFGWFLDAKPTKLHASGGLSFFEDREHFDNVMCIFDYDTPQGNARAFYQVLTTTSAGGGYYESFMGTEGTVAISEREDFTNIYKESSAPGEKWEHLVSKGYLLTGGAGGPAGAGDAIESYASAAPDKFALPGGLGVYKNRHGEYRARLPHQYHVENFFEAIRGNTTLNCDARKAFEAEAPVYWVNPAAESGETIHFTDEHLKV